MPESAPSVLAAWTGFFATMCTSASALIGLMFVVVTLVSGTERLQHSQDGLSTFSTPTVMHFAAAMFVSAVLIAPWHSLLGADVTIAVAALAGLIYSLRVLFRTGRVSNYTPDAEDWTWYTIMPFLAYGAVFAGALTVYRFPGTALFVVAAGVLTLIFIGIRNAWDVVTFIAVNGPPS